MLPTEISAQANGGVNVLNDLWTAAKAAGVFGALIMLTLYWRSEKRAEKLQADRDKLLDERDKLLREVITVTYSATQSINAATEAMKSIMSSMHTIQSTLARAEQLLAETEVHQRGRGK